MSLGVFLAVMAAALLHAGWNAIIRFGRDKFQGMFLLSVCQGVMGAVLIFLYPLPTGQTWAWLAGSAVLHSGYKAFLTFAYMHGDLSRVYPIARGTAPMLVALTGAFLLADIVAPLEYFGILLIGAGIVMMARGVFVHGESRALLSYAFASAVMTAGYSLFDGFGARVAGDAAMYVAWMFVLDGVLFLAWGLWYRGRSAMPRSARLWGLGALAGAASYGAYGIAVWAMTVAPIALVTALRETSVLFAVLIGVVFFGERADRGKLAAAVLIAGGVAMTRL
ncbi:MAG: EamA family transporter [Rhodobacteraceae bacterium]|nr:EamA family transporter [Paracoccaceae bacterium]